MTRAQLSSGNAPLEWWERDQAYIPAQGHLALLLDLLADRGLNFNYALSRTRIFYEDVFSGEYQVSNRQLAQLCLNMSKLPGEQELSFLFGQRLLPGMFQDYSHLLSHAPNLASALGLLEDYACIYFPMLKLRIQRSAQRCQLLVEDPFGELAAPKSSSDKQKLNIWLIETLFSAVLSFCQWRAAKPLPWQVNLAFSAPPRPELYEVYLGRRLNFDCAYNSLSIDVAYLDTLWPEHSETRFRLALANLKPQQGKQGLLSLVRKLMRQALPQIPSLAELAEQLAMSPATLKRKLQQHHSCYRLLCDEVRQEQVFHLRDEYGYSDEQLAQQLNFFDVSNFRRALRRWSRS
ncbi:AraC family transcriptional regulator [Agarivorans gilvus]|uniref:AraC family transcriptional regulator n=1 Tax=Agarivorans gilvus TaxID=680279 RepID=A0ABQ1I204_9ALTE|nr:AraC family transcriptional regulator [Agarivorans gilvus]GGB02275.1 AraC family transcriptional regulator [Agarivorans gilvus]